MAQRAPKTRKASFNVALRHGNQKSIIKQKKWLEGRIQDLEDMLDVHEPQLKAVDTEIERRKTEGRWDDGKKQHEPTRRD